MATLRTFHKNSIIPMNTAHPQPAANTRNTPPTLSIPNSGVSPPPPVSSSQPPPSPSMQTNCTINVTLITRTDMLSVYHCFFPSTIYLSDGEVYPLLAFLIRFGWYAFGMVSLWEMYWGGVALGNLIEVLCLTVGKEVELIANCHYSVLKINRKLVRAVHR